MRRALQETALRIGGEFRALRSNDFTSSINGPDGLAHKDHASKIISKLVLARVEAIKFPGPQEPPDRSFSWQADDMHIGINVPFLFKRRYTPEAVRKSLHTLARFITYNGLQADDRVRVVGGLTHGPLATAAKRYDFRTTTIPVNPAIDLKVHSPGNIHEFGIDPHEFATAYEVAQAIRVYDLLGLGATHSPKKRQALFAYRPVDDFLDQYLDPELQDWRENPPHLHNIQPLTEFGYPQIPDHIHVRQARCG